MVLNVDESIGCPVVIDMGSSMIKAGFAWSDSPQSIFPASSLIGRKTEEEHHGDEIQSSCCEKLVTVTGPIERGIITNWRDMEKIWHHTFYNELGVSPEKQPVLLTEAPLNPKANRERMAQIMFNTFHVPAMFICTKAVLSLYAFGRTTGLVIASGNDVSHTVPIHEGLILPHAVMYINLAGRDLTNNVMRIINDRGHSSLSTTDSCIVDHDFARLIKEKFIQFVPLDVETNAAESEDAITLDYGSEPIRYPELLLHSNIVPDKIAHATIRSIMKCNVDIRKDLFSNIILTGGNTMFQGLGARLQKDIQKMVPSSMEVKIDAPPERHLSVWIGGSILASLLSKDLWISMADYAAEGPRVVHRKCA